MNNLLDSADVGLIALPIKELQSIKKRVDFYVEHYSTIIKNRKYDDITYNDKLVFLSNFNTLLEREISNRA
jgi:hypothetical protein